MLFDKTLKYKVLLPGANLFITDLCFINKKWNVNTNSPLPISELILMTWESSHDFSVSKYIPMFLHLHLLCFFKLLIPSQPSGHI